MTPGALDRMLYSSWILKRPSYGVEAAAVLAPFF